MPYEMLHWISLVLRRGFTAHRPKTFKIHTLTPHLGTLDNMGSSMLYIKYLILLQKYTLLQEGFAAVM